MPSAFQRLNDIVRLEPPIPETLRPMPRDLVLDEFRKDFGDRAVADSCPEIGPHIVCHCDTSHPIAPGGHRFGCRRSLDSLSDYALEALEALPPRLDTPLLFPAPAGGLMNLDNFRRREWGPAIEAAAVARPVRIYDLRSTFASDALAAGVTVLELAIVMGTSVRMIERHYGTLLDGASAGIAGRLNAHRAERLQDTDQAGGR